MYVEKETEKALLLVLDAVPFWVQKRWLKADGTLTPAGWKAFHIAKRAHWQNFSFDALKEFETVRETEKAVLLRCVVDVPDSPVSQAEFWLPLSMTGNYNFVAKKVMEVEAGYPFIGTHVRWRGAAKQARQREQA